MTIRAHLDEAFAREFGLPQLAPPMSLQAAADEANHEAVNGLFAEESDDEH